MNALELFSGAIRIVGLIAIFRAINDLIYVALFQLGMGDTSVTARFPQGELIYGMAFLIVGLYFLRGAPAVVNFAFPDTSEPADEEIEG